MFGSACAGLSYVVGLGVADTEAINVDLSPDGCVMEVLSEHLCDGNLLPGRHRLFSCYEAFIQRD